MKTSSQFQTFQMFKTFSKKGTVQILNFIQESNLIKCFFIWSNITFSLISAQSTAGKIRDNFTLDHMVKSFINGKKK